MPDFTVQRGGCSIDVREKDGNHYVHWVESSGSPFDYLAALKALKKESRRLGVSKLHFFIEPENTGLMLLYDRAGAKVEAVVMSYEVTND